MRFGISTHLYHDQHLDRGHLAEIASCGFEAIELFATRSHFDYRDERAIDSLKSWLDGTGVRLHSVHAPITDRFAVGDAWAPSYSNALADNARRQQAVRETEAALQIARRIPFETLVVHLGTPDTKAEAGDNTRAAAVRSVEEICRLAEPLGVRVALEVIPNTLSTPTALADLIVTNFDGSDVSPGICLDFGHAFLGGDLADAIEEVAEHLVSTHVHDNHRRADDHLVPYQGAIDWDAALMSMQKIGYDGTYVLELANTGTPGAVLEGARRACERFGRTVSHP